MDLNFLINKAVKYHVQGRIEKAELNYKKILKFDPKNILVNNNLASIFNLKKKYEEALVILNNVLIDQPDFDDALNNKGIALVGLNRFEEALKQYDKVLNIKPYFLKAINNKANCLKLMGLYEEALKYYKKALSLEPNFIEAIYNRAICFYEINNFDDAEKLYNKAIKLKPDFVEANYNLSLIKLLKSNYLEGWKHYEWRKKRSNFKKYQFSNNEVEWFGEQDLNNKVIYIIKEQALGDYIQYCRYFPLIKKMGAKIILDPPEPLKIMIDNMDFSYIHINEAKKIKIDYYCSLASLPLAFNTTIDTIPNKIPYLFTPKETKIFWNKKLNNNKIKIGLKWSGNPKYKDDKNRSMPLEKLKPLFELPYEYHSLHIEYSDEDKKMMQNIPNLFCHKDHIIGLDNTAGLIESMNLVISVDTGIVQLTGALGKQFWNMLPFTSDHRWLLNRDDSPWFPTAKLYRQTKKGDWDTIIQNIKKDLLSIK